MYTFLEKKARIELNRGNLKSSAFFNQLFSYIVLDVVRIQSLLPCLKQFLAFHFVLQFTSCSLIFHKAYFLKCNNC